MSTPPIEVPDEFVVKDPFTMLEGTDKTKIIEFFGLISRMEYAVTLTGYKNTRSKQMKVDWMGFAKAMNGKLINLGSLSVSYAIHYLVTNPPKEFLSDMTWGTRNYDTDLSIDARAILAAKDVRNNLFHGMKYENPERHRNNELLAAAITVFKACINADNELKIYFNS